jgi:hypothetical protein
MSLRSLILAITFHSEVGESADENHEIQGEHRPGHKNRIQVSSQKVIKGKGNDTKIKAENNSPEFGKASKIVENDCNP